MAARLSLPFLLLSLLSLALALDTSVLDIPQSEPHFPQFSNPEFLPESESEPVVPQFPNHEPEEEKREIPELPISEKPEEKPEFTETVQYILIPVNRLRDVRDFDDIGFSLRLPMRHGHRHHHHRFGGPGQKFGRRFGHRFVGGGFPGGENQMEDRNMEMPEMPQLKEDMEMHQKFFNYDKTEMPMNDEEKMERAKEMMKKMRKCKHQHMKEGMHGHHEHHHEHHHGPRDEPREEPREEREEGGFMKQFWNLFNF